MGTLKIKRLPAAGRLTTLTDIKGPAFNIYNIPA